MNKSMLIDFNGNNSSVKLSVDFEGETVWATQPQIAELFGVRIGDIARHISNIYITGELTRESTVLSDSKNNTFEDLYNLDLILAVGYRVNSSKATEFRKWATKQLKELIVNGFAIDENRFANGQLEAFQKLVERVRAIRTSESNLFKQIQAIFATSVDYYNNSEEAKYFFATVQNKFHFAIHGHTAAELIKERADANKINMGLTSWKGKNITIADARIAKNYLSELEAKKLELLSEQFLSYAELRYYDKKTMTMKDWNNKLNEFLGFNEKEVLTRRSLVSQDEALMAVDKQISSYRIKK